MLAGPAPPGLDLVGNEQYPGAIEHLLESAEEAIGGSGEAADTLNRFGDHASDVTGRCDFQQILEVGLASSDELAVGKVAKRAAQFVPTVDEDDVEGVQARRRPVALARDRHGGMALSVIAPANRQNLIRFAVLGGQHQSR